MEGVLIYEIEVLSEFLIET